jgi:hypothetical protein
MGQIIGKGIVIIYDYYFHLLSMLNVKLELLCNVNRLGQRTELVVTLF